MIKKIINFTPFELLRIISRSKITIVLYHEVSNEPLPHLEHLHHYYSSNVFEKHIQFYKEHFNTITLKDLTDYFYNGKDLPPKPLLITFDDGLAGFFHNAVPILKKHSLFATNFLNPDFISNKDIAYNYKKSILISTKGIKDNLQAIELLRDHGFQSDNIKESIGHLGYLQRALLDELADLLGVDFKEYLSKYKPYMDKDQINQLIKDGFTFGAHCMDHPNLKELDESQQISQAGKSLDYIQKEFDLTDQVYASPFSDEYLSLNFYKTMKSKYNTNFSFGTAGIKDDNVSWSFQRLWMESSNESVLNLLKNEYFKRFMRKLFRRNRIIRT